VNLEEMKEKASCDYSLKENIVVALIAAGFLLCIIFDVGLFVVAIVIESVHVALLVIPITLLGAVLLALLLYIDPDW
jgi:uncharacterized membrane-anchored protein